MAKSFDWSGLDATPVEKSESFDWSGLEAKPTKKPSKADRYKRRAAQFGRNAAATIGDVAATPFALVDLATYLPRAGLAKAERFIGRNLGLKSMAESRDPTFGEYIPQWGDKIGQTIDSMTGDYTKPTTDNEKLTEAATRSVLGLGTGVGAGNLIAKTAQYAPKAAGTLTKGASALKKIHAPTSGNIGASLGSSLASQQYLNMNPEDANPWVAAGLGLGTGYGGQKLGRFAENIAVNGPSTALANRTGKMLRFNTGKAEIMGDLPYSLGDVTDSSIAKAIQNKLEWAPGATGTMEKFYKKQGQAIRNKLGIDDAVDSEEAGQLIHKSATHQRAKHNTEMGALQEAAAEKLGENLSVKAPQSLSFNKEYGDVYTTPTGRETYLSGEAPREATKLEKIAQEQAALTEGKASKPTVSVGGSKTNFDAFPAHIQEQIYKELGIADPLKEAGLANKLPFHEMQLIKRKIDNSVSTFGLIGKQSEGELKLLRGRIKADLDNHFTEIGGEAKDVWDEYNKKHSLFSKHDKPSINEILKESEKDFSSAFVDAANSKKTNPAKLRVIYQGLDEADKGKVFSAFVDDLGRKGSNDWNIFQARTKFNAMRPRMQNLFLEGLPSDQARKDFRKTMSALDLINEKKLQANTSGTSYHESMDRTLNEVKNLAKAAGKGAIAIGTTGAAGLAAGIGAPAAIMGSLLTAPLAAKYVFTNEKMLRWVANGMRKKSESDFIRHFKKAPEMKGAPQVLVNEVRNFGHVLNQTEGKKYHKPKISVYNTPTGAPPPWVIK